MERKVAVALAAVTIGLASQGCGDVDEGQQESDQVETVQSALGGFGAWNFASGRELTTGPAPALARGTGTASLVAFARDASQPNGGGIVVTTQSASSGNWSFFFSGLSSPFGFTAGPSAVLIDVPQGPLLNHYAIVAKRTDDQFYITIRDRTGRGVVQDWAPLPGGIFSQSFSAPAITFIPASSTVGPLRTLVVTGVGNDGVVYWARNTIAADFTYHHDAWTLFFQLPGGNPANQTFVGPPAITFACQNNLYFPLGPKSSMALAVMASDPNGTRTFFSRKYNGTSWSGWAQLQGGTFHDGPALAGRPGCSATTQIALFGLGEDDQAWVTTQLSGGTGEFRQLPIAPQGSIFVGEPNPPLLPPHFAGAPSAVGTASAANVAALTYMGEMTSNAASP